MSTSHPPIIYEPPEALVYGRHPSSGSRRSAAGHPPRSSFAGSRQASEESRSIRFFSPVLEEPGGVEAPIFTTTAAVKSPQNWKNRARRISRIPTTGLTRIRVGGHLNYSEIIKRAERQSTWHGISHAALAPNPRWRHFWHTIFAICMFFLIIQIIFLVSKYRSYDKTVDLDLKFENAPFPSITLCNLNPYKKSLIMENPKTKQTIDAFANLINKGDQSEGVAAILAARINTRVRRQSRKRRRKDPRRYHQVFAQCLCDVDPRSGERKTFPDNSWKEKLCSECVDDSGHCPMRFYKGNEPFENVKEVVDLCLCHRDYNHCVANNDDGIIPEIDPNEELSKFNISSKSQEALFKLQRATTTTTTQAPEVVEALGFDDVTDEIAITTIAKENLMFAVGEMTPEKRVELSHNKHDFILKCSFNQKDCNIDDDFKLHYDQTYGNCYTFNWNRSSAVTAHRAGANYGLRVMLYADVNEYLPTSDAIGFRITVHDKWIVPFPDAFGYNAPTGFLSSFGVRMKQFLRIVAPHGHCKSGGEESSDFIYTGFNYSVEACHRSCTQKKIGQICGCTDPMYPLPRVGNYTPCPVTNNVARECIRNMNIELGQKIAEGSIEDCNCHQPCQETNYEVTYSAARWPSGSAKVMECTADDYLCLEKYRKNAAMVQIFYEELNYETLIETEAYSLSSFIADLGGVTGLWVGASIVSLMEIVTLVIFAAQTYVRNKKEEGGSGSLHNSTGALNKLSVQIQERMSLSTHSSKSRVSIHSQITQNSRKSRRSLLIDEPAIEEGSDRSSADSGETGQSLRYIAPGDDLPCLCKYNEMGHIIVMKALCPVHGYMVRRNYDYSVSNSEEDMGEEEDEVHKDMEPYYPTPYDRRASRASRRSRHKASRSGMPAEAVAAAAEALIGDASDATSGGAADAEPVADSGEGNGNGAPATSALVE